MPTSYTSLLGLALPVTGELSGTWGDTVNDYITKYLDASVAGTQIISGSQTAVTLSPTNGSSLTQVGSGSTGSSQYGIIRCSGNPASTLTITVSYSSLTNAQFSQNYAVINATSTNQSVVVRATTSSGTSSGVTLVAGENAVLAWNGSDFVKIATSTADGVTTLSFGSTGLTPSTATSGAVTVAGTLATGNGGTGLTTFTAANNALYSTSSSALTAGTLPVAAGGTGLTSGTSGGIPYYSATNTLASSAALTANQFIVGGGAGASPVSSSLLTIAAAVTTGNYVRAIGYADTVTALGNTGTAINIDVTSGGVFTATLTGNCTFTLRYPVATGASSFTLILTNDGTAGRTVAWAGGSFLFPGGAASLSRTTTANAVDVWVFFTPNGGTTWYGNIAMKNMTA